MHPARALVLAACLPSLGLAGERVQAPDAPWRTCRTPHYRIHFPARGDFEPFAQEVASKIEGIHAQVVAWVGYASPVPVEVVIRDPVLEANGFALPLLEHPFVVLWKTPPEADSGLGHATTWAELLVTHELTHIHHLLRPQNQPDWRDRLLDLPVGPLARKAPRWVSEGYATLVEGRITGKGRPHSAYRAAVIRQWALEGKLPDYGSLSAPTGFRGGSMAYLVGSAYLEWLEARNPKEPDLLKRFWKQLVSKRRRTFAASFEATFGVRPQDGYDRWRAEVSHDALDLERRMQGRLREGDAWAQVDGELTDLAVSPDGTRLLARVASPDFTGLAVWDLTATDPHGKSPKAKPAAAGKADPEEVEDRPPAVPVRKPVWKLARVAGAVPRRAAWAGGSVALEYRLPDAEGVLRPRFAAWTPGSEPRPGGPLPRAAHGYGWKEVEGIWNLTGPDGTVLTRTLSAAWNPAPSPDGKALYFTRLRATGVEIRKLDLGQAPLEAGPVPGEAVALAPGTVLPPPDGPSRIPAAGAVPEAGPYEAWRGLWNGSRFGLSQGPGGRSWQAGYGGADILGQASWQVLGAAGDAAGPRGGTLGLAWRGWRWAPSVEVFSSLERPSRQDWLRPAGLDRERRGAEVALTFEDKGTWPHTLRLDFAAERAVVLDAPGASPAARRRLGLEAALARQWRPWGSWSFSAGAGLQAFATRTEGRASTLQRLQATLRVSPPKAFPPAALRLETGQVGGGDAPAQDRFRLGGLGTSLVPASLDAQRVEQAALPALAGTGDRLRRGRLELGRIVRLYLEHTAVWDGARPRPAFQRVAGLELVPGELLAGNALDTLLGRMSLGLGVHRLLDGGALGPEFRGRAVVTASVVLRP